MGLPGVTSWRQPLTSAWTKSLSVCNLTGNRQKRTGTNALMVHGAFGGEGHQLFVAMCTEAS